MKIFSRFPVFRFAIPFSTGIISVIEVAPSPWLLLTFSTVGFLSSFLFTRRNYATGKYAQRWLAGIPFYCCFFGLGGMLTWVHQTKNYPDHYVSTGQDEKLIVEIIDEPVSTRSGYRFAADVVATLSVNEWKASRGKILVYIAGAQKTFYGLCGQTFLLSGNVNPILPPQNPFAFNAAQHYAGKGMWHQVYIAPGNYELINPDFDKTPFYFARALRNALLQKLKKYLGENELGVAGALLLGYEEWLDPELESYWSGAGVLHVLCVSGMHVMLIYVIFAGITVWMEKNKMLRHLRYLLLLLLIWFYAMVTGFSPSVIRAAAMITFIIAGKWMNRDASIYNLLCSSCMLLFLMNPYLVMSAGFQLSFLAVCGIIFLHQRIFTLWVAPNKFLHKTWELISVSIAAQISTFPLSLFLFHQFPNYFLVANLLVIPLSTLVMYSGLLLLVTDWIPYAGMVTGHITSAGIQLLNRMVIEIGKLPGALTQNVFIDLFETISLYLLIIFIMVWLTQKSFSWFIMILIVVVCLLSNRVMMLYDAATRTELTVFHTKNNPLVAVVEGGKAYLVSDTLPDEKQLRFVASEYLVRRRVQEQETLISKNEFLEIKINNAPAIYYLNGLEKGFLFPSKMQMESGAIIILSGKVAMNAAAILIKTHPAKVIFDNTCRGYELNKIKTQFRKAGIKIHSVKQEGAFRSEWSDEL